MSGKTFVEKNCTDDVFNVSLADCIKLKREVEMFQWEETSREHDDRATEYEYKKVWKSYVITSNNFHDHSKQNPGSMPVDSQVFNNEVKLGRFTMSEG